MECPSSDGPQSTVAIFSPQLKSELFRAHVATLSQKLLPLSTLLFPPPMSLLQIQ